MAAAHGGPSSMNNGGAPNTMSAKAAASEWSKFGLPKNVAKLDAFAQAAPGRVERASNSRKKLVEETKKFKASLSGTPELLDVAAPLVKAFQAEIDALTKRATAAEGLIGEFQQGLSKLPDPSPLLKANHKAEEELNKLKVEKTKLAREVTELEGEISTLKNQDITIRTLETRVLELEHELVQQEERSAEERAHEIELDRQRADAEYEHEWEELRQTASRAEREALEQRRAADQVRAELYELKALAEEKEASRQAELDHLSEELLTAKRELEASQQRSASQGAHGGESSEELEIQAQLRAAREAERERDAARREEELAKAYLALDAARAEASRCRQAESDAIRAFERESEEMKKKHEAQAKEWEAKLEEAGKRVANLETSTAAVAPESAPAPSASSQDAARVIAGLESQAVSLRLDLEKKETELQELRTKALKLEERDADQRELIQKLQVAELAATTDAAAAAAHSLFGGDGERARFHAAPAADFAGGAASNSHNNVLAIVQDQRDRFRRRMLELEEQLEQSKLEAGRFKELADVLRAEALRGAASDAKPSHSVFLPPPRARSLGGAASASSRAGFQGASSLLRLLLVNSSARSLVLVYVLALHLLVMASLHRGGEACARLDDTSSGGGLKAASLLRNGAA